MLDGNPSAQCRLSIKASTKLRSNLLAYLIHHREPADRDERYKAGHYNERRKTRMP